MKNSIYAVEKTSFITVLILFVLIIGLFQIARTKSPTASEENKALLKRIIEEGYNKRNPGVADGIFSSNYVTHTNGIKGEIIGPEVVKNNINSNIESYPDFKLTIEDMVAEGDRVAMRWIFKGTSKQYSIKITINGIYIAKFFNGKIVEGWQIYDSLNVMEKLGFTITPPNTKTEQ